MIFHNKCNTRWMTFTMARCKNGLRPRVFLFEHLFLLSVWKWLKTHPIFRYTTPRHRKKWKIQRRVFLLMVLSPAGVSVLCFGNNQPCVPIESPQGVQVFRAAGRNRAPRDKPKFVGMHSSGFHLVGVRWCAVALGLFQVGSSLP